MTKGQLRVLWVADSQNRGFTLVELVSHSSISISTPLYSQTVTRFNPLYTFLELPFNEFKYSVQEKWVKDLYIGKKQS